MKKIRILFTIPNFTSAGSGREMMNIVYRLDPSMFDITIAVEIIGGLLYDELQLKGYKTIVHPHTVSGSTGMLSIIKAAKKLAEFYKKYRFDVWQSFGWSSDFSEALVAKFSGAQYVYVKKNMNWDRAAWKVKSFLSKAIVARNTTLLLTHLFPPYLRRKTFYIGGGVDTDRFISTPDKSYKDQLNIPADACLVTCIAQLVRVKDQLTLIKAVAELNGVYLVLAGAAKDEEYVAEMHALIKELKLQDRITIPGAVSEVNALLNASDVFVLPTTNIGGHEEGCPVSLLEAMSAQIPCIASNVSGSRDLVVTNETGLLFKPGNVSELTACIRKYINDRAFAKKMAYNARELVLQEHTLEKEFSAFEAMYKKIMRVRKA